MLHIRWAFSFIVVQLIRMPTRANVECRVGDEDASCCPNSERVRERANGAESGGVEAAPPSTPPVTSLSFASAANAAAAEFLQNLLQLTAAPARLCRSSRRRRRAAAGTPTERGERTPPATATQPQKPQLRERGSRRKERILWSNVWVPCFIHEYCGQLQVE